MSLKKVSSGEIIEFKGNKKGIIINIKKVAPFDVVKDSIINRLEEYVALLLSLFIESELFLSVLLLSLSVFLVSVLLSEKLADTDKINAAYLRRAIKKA